MMGTTTHQMTAEELIRLDDGYRHELIKGELLTMSPSDAEHGELVVNLTVPFATYVKQNSLGVVFGAETGFKLESDPDTVLAPDIAFVSRERVSVIPANYWAIAPDLVVEVISPSEREREVKNKTQQWLGFGVRLVWLVKPKSRTVEIHRVNKAQVLTVNEILSGEEVVPGFEISVTTIFE
jgi:Uma2 family endonuclease